MPEMDGFEVARQIRAVQDGWFEGLKKQDINKLLKAKRECPIVAITAHVDDSVEKKAMAVKMKEVINKPVFIDRLRQVLEKYYFK